MEVTERAFRTQRRRMDARAAQLGQAGMVAECRGRLGEGQAMTLLSAYFGHPVAAPADPAPAKPNVEE